MLLLGFCAWVCCKESHLHHEVGGSCVCLWGIHHFEYWVIWQSDAWQRLTASLILNVSANMNFGVVVVMVGSNMLHLPVDSCSQPMSCHFDERYHCCIARNIANSAWAYATTQLPSIWARKDTELLLDVRVLTALCMEGCLLYRWFWNLTYLTKFKVLTHPPLLKKKPWWNLILTHLCGLGTSMNRRLLRSICVWHLDASCLWTFELIPFGWALWRYVWSSGSHIWHMPKPCKSGRINALCYTISRKDLY